VPKFQSDVPKRFTQSLGARNSHRPQETFMKLLLASMLLLLVSACTLAPIGGGGKAGGDTVVVCHKGKKTLELPSSAADAHLGHGDRRGPC
jgi:hypothetical protein